MASTVILVCQLIVSKRSWLRGQKRNRVKHAAALHDRPAIIGTMGLIAFQGTIDLRSAP